MKKLLFFAAMMLGLASCQTEPEGLGVDMGAQETNITVALPEITRANSANSGWENTGNNLRVILQVFDENDATNDAMRQVEPLTAGETTVNFKVRLVPGHDYTFVAWADQDTDGNISDDDYFITTDLKNVTFATDAWTAMNEEIDAYTATTTIPKGESIPNVTLSLTRPFAKIRVVTTDIEAIRNLDWDPTTAVASYNVNIPTSFNAFAGTIGTDNVVKPTRDITYNNQYTDKAGEMTLYSDYIFIPAAGTVQFGLKVNHAGGEIRTTNFNTEIPAVRNHLTTIKGNILTGDNNINVEVSVNDEFEKENSVFYAFSNGGTVTLDKNYELGSTLYVESGVKATLNLNGKTLKSLYDANNYTDVIVVEAGAELTINGDGTIEAEGGKSNFTVIVDGKLTINGGTFKSGIDENGKPNAVIYARGNGEVYVNGGNFPNEHNSTFVLNKKDADRANTTIEVRGGRFHNFDPANNVAENPKESFVATGYVSVANGEWFDVVSKDSIAIDDVTELKKAIERGDETINLKGGVVFEGVFEFTSMNQNTTIICHNTENKATLKGRVAISDAAVTFENINFDYNEATKQSFYSFYNAQRGWNSSPANHPAIVGVNANAHAATFKYCDFKFRNGYDEDSYAPGAICHWGGKLTIDNCNFEGINYPIYAYTNFEMTNCTIKFSHPTTGVAVGMNYQAPGKLVFKNNKLIGINDSVLTAGFFFLSTQSWGKVYADIKNNECKYVAGNPSKITSVEYADGSDTLNM